MNLTKVLPEDFAKINSLLKLVDLPLIDKTEQSGYFCKAVDSDNEIIGTIGLEVHKNYGLLRSLVVTNDNRNRGIAQLLIRQVESEAQKSNLKAIFLLTTTASKYFEKYHYRRLQREDVPEEIKQSKEFSIQCPTSATVMVKYYQH